MDAEKKLAKLLIDISSGDCDAQDKKNFWAIEECFKRTNAYQLHEKQIISAKKNQQCTRGCDINSGDKYFKIKSQYYSQKICASCMAMILFHQEAHLMPVVLYDYWDEKENAPHTNDKVRKDIRGVMGKM